MLAAGAVRPPLAVTIMPLLRYFLFAGGVLLGLLFAIDCYAPPRPAQAARAEIDRSIIRIHSSHRWPAPVAIETEVEMPNIAPLASVSSGITGAAPTTSAAGAHAAFLPEAPKPADRSRRHAAVRSRSAPAATRLASRRASWLSAAW